MNVLKSLLLPSGLLFLALSLSFSVSADGAVTILWRDNTALAVTFTLIGVALLTSRWFLSQFSGSRRRDLSDGAMISFRSSTGPYNIFGKMEPAVRLRMGVAVFLTFSIIGPISVLMSLSTQPVNPVTVVITTVASGCIGSSFIFFGNRKILLVIAFLFFQALNLSAPEIAHRITNTPPPLPAESVSTARLADISAQRKLIGVLAIFLLTSGYIMWIIVLNKEGAQRIRYQTEVQVAREIQQRLLPSDRFRTRWYEAYGITKAAADVGGDYFDVVELSDDRVAIVVADVSGHGIGAGIVSTMTKSALRAQLLHDPSPVAVMRALNTVMLQVSDKRTFVTLAYVLLDRVAKTASIATAGHPPVFHCTGTAGVHELRTQSLGLGMHPAAQFHEIRKAFAPGDMFVLYTDGVIEAVNEASEQFGAERLKEHVTQAHSQSILSTPDSILDAVKVFTDNEQFADDATVVSVRLT